MQKRLAILLLIIASTSCLAQTFQNNRFSRILVSNGISGATAFVFTPDGRIFVTEQSGKLRVIKNGTLLATPFVQLTVDSNGERGLLGVALDPNFSTNGFVYLYYTTPTAPIHNKISRFKANGDVSDGSETLIIDFDNLSTATNHNGGAIAFGSDGKLYVAIGENANGAHAQNLDTYHGKLLRINSDGSVPAGNPFTGSEQKKRVWAYGLRNPYTFTFQPSTNKLYVNDVGQSTFEEINDATLPGLNFGWPTVEGDGSNSAFTNPVFSYGHGSGDGKGCAITGGTFFNPTTTNYPSTLIGKYFYQDLCNAWINYISLAGTIERFPFATNVGGQSLGITTGPDGNLYYLSRSDASLYKILYDNSGAPAITIQPSNVTVSQNQPASVSVVATGNATLTYQWKKDNVSIAGATSSTYTIPLAQPSDNGNYKVVIANSVNEVTSNEVSLTVTANPITAIEEDDKKNLVVYPSPARHWLYVQCEKELIESIELRDNMGRVKITPLPEKIGQDIVAVDVRSLASGMYYVLVKYPGGISARKLIIGEL